MGYIRLLVISVLVLFVMLAGLSLVFPSHLRISRAINIAATRDKTWAEINDLKTWDTWNEFIRLTPLTGKSFSSPSSGKGAELRSDQLQMKIVESVPDSIRLDWRQTGGKSFTGGFNLLRLYPDSLTVQWYFDFHFRWYPWERIGSLVYDKKLGPVMELSLAGLKKELEGVQH